MAGKKSKPNGKGQEKSGAQGNGKMQGLSGMEKMMADLTKIIQDQKFDSLEEMNAFLEDLTASGPIPSSTAETPLQEAQELMYDAWEAIGPKRVKLARQALAISPDCADAYVLLAEEDADSLDDAKELYEKGVQAGERAIGKEMFKEGVGHFWGILETRPYMRARQGLAYTLWLLGARRKAINHLQDMLRLNPGDNQGIRYILFDWLLAEEGYGDLAQLLLEFDGEITAHWTYNKALLAFRQEGASSEAQLQLIEALSHNIHVPEYLLGGKIVPSVLPDYVGFGDENEAVAYADSAIPLWVETPGALEWLAEVRKSYEVPDSDVSRQTADLSPIWLGDLDLDEDDLDEDDLEYDDFPRPFDMDQFLADLEIPKKEQASFRRSFSTGIGKYYYDIYGHYKFGKRPEFLIEERMGEPHIFGWGAVEVLQHKNISTDSKLKVCQYTIDTTDLLLEEGVPYGLVTILGFMAAEDKLTGQDFLGSMLVIDSEVAGTIYWRDRIEGGTIEAMVALTDWLGAHQEIPDGEKLWWVWKLSLYCDNKPHHARALAKNWLGRPDVTDEMKIELCWAWLLDQEEVGRVPLAWRVKDAFESGDADEVKQILEEQGLDPQEMLPPEWDEMLFRPDDETSESIYGLFDLRRRFVMVPTSLKRLAIPALVRFGEDFDEIAEMFWDSERSYYVDTLNAGIADAIEEFHERLTQETLRLWIERGIGYGKAPTRKRFYALSTEFFGNEYLERALDDNAKSVRTWAAKKLRKGQ